jgi:hypothetical protein
MTINDLLLKQDIDPANVIVMRHRPNEPGLRKVLPWLVHEKPDVFNAYQQKHGPRVEAAMEKLLGAGYVASFVGLKPGQAVFAGLYRIQGAKPVNSREYWAMPANQVLRSFGMPHWKREEQNHRGLWFDLALQDFHKNWSGKLIVTWPPPERAWWRRAERNEMAVVAIREESVFVGEMPDWHDLVLTWAELQAIPVSWRAVLNQWRGIYFIHDESDGTGYVGSAYGKENILGRWLNYAASGHGGNKRLRTRKAEHFHFSILQRVSPDMEANDVIRLESSWKDRLHTRGTFGLNEN